MRLFLDIFNSKTKQDENSECTIITSYLNRAMRTLRRSILEMVTKIIAKIKAIVEYESVPSIHKLITDQNVKSITNIVSTNWIDLSKNFPHAIISYISKY